MPWGVERRWYCSNVAHCERARSDYPFLEADIARDGQICGGEKGCGKPLNEGKPLDRRPRWLATTAAAVALALALAWLARTFIFPPPLEGVDFALHQQHVQQNAGVASLTVSRTANVDRRETVHFISTDGTAHAGTHYEAVAGDLVFAPGETSKSVRVNILPGTGYLRSDVYFQVTLSNVVNMPHQVVVIEEPKVDDTQQAQADRVVRAASVVAKDIADEVVRERVLTRLLAATHADQNAFDRYQRALETIRGNLTRARESYAQSFRDMHGMQPRVVMDAMDRIAEDQDHNGFSQQAHATGIMKRQFAGYLSNGNIDMDRWADELSSVVPKAPGGPASAL